MLFQLKRGRMKHADVIEATLHPHIILFHSELHINEITNKHSKIGWFNYCYGVIRRECYKDLYKNLTQIMHQAVIEVI